MRSQRVAYRVRAINSIRTHASICTVVPLLYSISRVRNFDGMYLILNHIYSKLGLM